MLRNLWKLLCHVGDLCLLGGVVGVSFGIITIFVVVMVDGLVRMIFGYDIADWPGWVWLAIFSVAGLCAFVSIFISAWDPWDKEVYSNEPTIVACAKCGADTTAKPKATYMAQDLCSNCEYEEFRKAFY